ncbi:hypothetical protein MBLNU13_g07027t1 [Cladosporium sp. NU13]
MPPTKTALGTAELVEQILAHLPAKQLFVDQRVCKTFANAIASVQVIQVKIFKRLPESSEKQASGPADNSMEGNPSLEVSGGAEPATNPQLRPILSPWLVVIPRMRKCTKGMRPRAMKDDSYLDTHFCDPLCRRITVRQTYLVDGDDFENNQAVQIDTLMTVREVLDKALDQTGPITDSFSQEPVIQCGTMRAIIKCPEQEKGFTDGSKTVLCKVEVDVQPSTTRPQDCYEPGLGKNGNVDSV